MKTKRNRKNKIWLLTIASLFLVSTLYSNEIIVALGKSNLLSLNDDQGDQLRKGESQIREVSLKLEELNLEVQSAEEKLATSEKNADNLKRKVSKLVSEEKVLTANLEKLKFEIVDKKNKKKLYELKESNLETELLELKNENSTMRQKIKELGQEVEGKAELENSVSALNKKNKELMDKVQSVPDKEKLLERSDELKEKIVKLNDQLIQQRELIKTYESSNNANFTNVDRNQNKSAEDYKKLILNLKKQHQNDVNMLRKEISRAEKYKVNFDELNGIKVVFSGFMGYDLDRKEIIFMTREGQKIMMVQDNFTGTLVGECGLPVISSDNETRCAATIIARLLFHKTGPIMKGLEIVEVRKK